MGWHGRLELRYRREGEHTRGRFSHSGPLRVLKALYPEGPGMCQHVIVHPPSGLVSGDRLEIDIELEAGAQALLTTPGATRFYRSTGEPARQHVVARLGEGARLEWLPCETLVYPAAQAGNALQFALAPGAEMMGWDIVALGLPEAGQPFAQGSLSQALAVRGTGPGGCDWLERVHLDAQDDVLLRSPLGLAGQGAWATMWWACGTPGELAAQEQALHAAREEAAASPLVQRCGVSALQPGLVVLRALAPRVEALSTLLRAVRRRWRADRWGAVAEDTRLWAT